MFQTVALEKIEAGLFPFGKHKDTPIADAPDSYVLYFADKHTEADVVVQALAAVCMGVAMERDLIAKREAARQERAELDAQSQHVGTIGERILFEGEVVSAFYREADAYSGGFWITKVRCGGNLITYIGNMLAERGETIKFKATVKKHDEYKGALSTVVNRPKIIEG